MPFIQSRLRRKTGVLHTITVHRADLLTHQVRDWADQLAAGFLSDDRFA